jgi:hypothetical protein
MMKGTTEIQPDVAFEAGDDWLKEISVSLRNVSPSKAEWVLFQAVIKRADQMDFRHLAAEFGIGLPGRQWGVASEDNESKDGGHPDERLHREKRRYQFAFLRLSAAASASWAA